MLAERAIKKHINTFSHSEECAQRLLEILGEVKEDDVEWGNFYFSLSDEISMLSRRIEPNRLRDVVEVLDYDMKKRIEYLLRVFPMSEVLRRIYAEENINTKNMTDL